MPRRSSPNRCAQVLLVLSRILSCPFPATHHTRFFSLLRLFGTKLMALYNSSRMSGKLLSIVASVWLITAAAFLLRAGFVWHQQRIIPHEVLASVPFEN